MTDDAMILSDFHALTDAFTEVVVGGTPGQWAAPSPCAGWVAGDVLDHVVDSQREFFARHGLDLGERPVGEPAAVWATHRDAALAALGDGAVLATEFDSVFGPSTVGRTLATFFNFDLVVHRWDLARALGGDTVFSTGELGLAEASLTELGDTVYAYGACGPAVEVGPDASRQEQVLARTGRDPRALPRP